MNSSYYKYCIVPKCKSTTIKTPNKLFIYVPNKEEIRKKWLELARRADAGKLSTNSRMYFCADHFDLPNDMVNYAEYHVMGTVSQVRMKPGCNPSKFDCQEDRKNVTSDNTGLPYLLKKRRKLKNAECPNQRVESCTQCSDLKKTSDTRSDLQTVAANVQGLNVQTADKYIQACIKPKLRSKGVQVKVISEDKALSPMKLSLTSISRSTSPFKDTVENSSPSVSILSKVKNVWIKEEPSDSDIPSYNSEDKKIEVNKTILNTIIKIEKEP